MVLIQELFNEAFTTTDRQRKSTYAPDAIVAVVNVFYNKDGVIHFDKQGNLTVTHLDTGIRLTGDKTHVSEFKSKKELITIANKLITVLKQKITPEKSTELLKNDKILNKSKPKVGYDVKRNKALMG